jgi:hypothetical protein
MKKMDDNQDLRQILKFENLYQKLILKNELQ